MSLDINQFAQSLKTAIVKGLTGARSATAPKNYVQAPEAYDGSRAGYETFRRNLELYVQAIPKDRDRILAALGFLTKDDADAWARTDGLLHTLTDHALSVGGTCTGEHGVGLRKRPYLRAEHGEALDLMRGVKALFDPLGLLNPGKVVGDPDTLPTWSDRPAVRL